GCGGDHHVGVHLPDQGSLSHQRHRHGGVGLNHVATRVAAAPCLGGRLLRCDDGQRCCKQACCDHLLHGANPFLWCCFIIPQPSYMPFDTLGDHQLEGSAHPLVVVAVHLSRTQNRSIPLAAGP